MSTRLVIALALLATFGAAPAQAATDVFPSAQIEGTNGYSISVTGFRDLVLISADSGPVGATYTAHDSITGARRLQADFEQYGEVDLRFERTKKTQRARSKDRVCEVITIRKRGVWTGTFSFQADAGLTSATAMSLPGTVELVRIDCTVKRPAARPAEEGGETTALLAHGPGYNPLFTAFQAGKQRKAAFGASVAGQRGRIESDFYAFLRAPGSTFAVDGNRATVSPPPPFSGTATFDKRADQRWTGDLAVELPVVGTVPLTGPDFEARLSRGWTGYARKALRWLP